MRDIDRIDSFDLLGIKFHLHRPLHHISDGIVSEPGVDEDADIFSLVIRDIDEELGVSERGDEHAIFLLGKSRKAKIFTFLHISLYSPS